MASEARAKHDEQFERLALVHLDSVYRLGRRLAGNTHEAEDLVQETFMRAYRAFGNFENRDGTALPWLMKICHNAFYSRLSKSSREPINLESTEGLGPMTDVEPDELIARSQKLPWENLDDQVKRAIESLPSQQREVLLLWAVEEMSYKQIADACEIAIGTVMSRLHRARAFLMDRLESYCSQNGLVGRGKENE